MSEDDDIVEVCPECGYMYVMQITWKDKEGKIRSRAECQGCGNMWEPWGMYLYNRLTKAWVR